MGSEIADALTRLNLYLAMQPVSSLNKGISFLSLSNFR